MRAREQILLTLGILFIFFVVQNYLLKRYLDTIVERPPVFDSGIQINKVHAIEPVHTISQPCPVQKFVTPDINKTDFGYLLDPDIALNSEQADLLYLCPDGNVTVNRCLLFSDAERLPRMAIVLLFTDKDYEQIPALIRKWEVFFPCSSEAPYSEKMDFIFYHNAKNVP
jgi:hypothetical protein